MQSLGLCRRRRRPVVDDGRLVRLDAPMPPERARRLADAERRLTFLARLMDDLVTIPGTSRRIGLDPILGLVPGLGDLAAAGFGAWIIAEARRFGLPGPVLGRMVVNLVLDLVVGAVPILGDLFDLGFRSNARNLELFRHHATTPTAATAGHTSFLAGLLLVLVGLGWLIVSSLGALLSIEIG